jgi:hypothetical protein
MKWKQTFSAMLCLFALSFAAAKPNLSGTWKLDKDRSFSNPPGLDQTMTIVHNGDEVKLDAKVTVQGREQQISETWTIDNQEHEFTPPGAAPGAKGKRKASWLPNGKSILVEDETIVKTPNGEVQQRTTRKYTLSADGSSLIVDYFIDRGAVSAESKRVFTKQ